MIKSYKPHLRYRISKPSIGNRIWVERRLTENLQPNGVLINVMYSEREAICEFELDRWHKKPDDNYETFDFERLAYAWTDKFGGLYMMLLEDEQNNIAKMDLRIKEIEEVHNNLHKHPMFIQLKNAGYL